MAEAEIVDSGELTDVRQTIFQARTHLHFSSCTRIRAFDPLSDLYRLSASR